MGRRSGEFIAPFGIGKPKALRSSDAWRATTYGGSTRRSTPSSRKLDPEDREVILGALEQAEKTEAELRYLADHDSLTGLLDRRRFRSELDQYVSFSARYGGQGAVMIIDIDGLKAVNDSLGHHAGDNLIRADRRGSCANGCAPPTSSPVSPATSSRC